MSTYLNEAFKKLDLLESEDFDLYDRGSIDELKDFKDEDAETDILNIIDDDAETEEDLEDSYVGKVIVECNVCHSLLYKNREELDFDEECDCVNKGEECPVCFSNDGYKIVGQVEPYEEVEITITDKDEEEPKDDEEEPKEEKEDKEDKEEVKESLEESCDKEEVDEGIAGAAIGGALANGMAKDLNPSLKVGATLAGAAVGSAIQNKKMDPIEKIMFAASTPKSESIVGAITGSDRVLDTVDNAVNNVGTVANTLVGKDSVLNGQNGGAIVGTAAKLLASDECEKEECESCKKAVNESRPDKDDFSDKVAKEVGRIKKMVKAGKLDAERVCKFVDKKFAGQQGLADAIKNELSNCDEGLLGAALGAIGSFAAAHPVATALGAGALGGAVAGGLASKKREGLGESTLTEKNWEYQLKCGKALRDAIEAEDYEELQRLMIEAWKELAEVFPEDVRDTDWEDIEFLSTEPDEETDMQDIEDNFNYELDNLYDFCDAYNVWIPLDESLNEDLNNIELDTDNQHIEIKSTPKEDNPDAEMIAPVDDTMMQDMLSDGEEEAPVEEEAPELNQEADEENMIDYPVEEFDEESFDDLGESYLKKVYENVESYKTTDIASDGNKIFIEGLIKFASGNTKKTSFIFEAKDADRNSKVRFIGENAQITRGRKAFTVTGKMNGNKFFAESLNYNYRQKNTDGASARVYGTVRVTENLEEGKLGDFVKDKVDDVKSAFGNRYVVQAHDTRNDSKRPDADTNNRNDEFKSFKRRSDRDAYLKQKNQEGDAKMQYKDLGGMKRDDAEKALSKKYSQKHSDNEKELEKDVKRHNDNRASYAKSSHWNLHANEFKDEDKDFQKYDNRRANINKEKQNELAQMGYKRKK